MSGRLRYERFDGMGLAELVRRGDVTASELVEEAIGRIEEINPLVNAVVYRMYDEARNLASSDLAQGAFAGVPFLLKDLGVKYAGVPTSEGCRLFRDVVPRYDCELVSRYRAAGLIVLGKTNTPELGLSPVTEPKLHGPCLNPWDRTRTAGGSSGGSAAAVAARMVPLAHGSDGGGSIRIPASCCGLFGLKPSRGRNPTGPEAGGHWQGLACDHVLTVSVRDSAAMLDVTSGEDPGAPYWAPGEARSFLCDVDTSPGRLRIAYTAEPFLPADVHEDCVRGLRDTVQLCSWLGHEMIEAVPQIDGEEFGRAYLTVVSGEIAAALEQASRSMGGWQYVRDGVEEQTWTMAELGGRFSAADFAWATRIMEEAGRKMARFFAEYDALLTPTLALPPVETGSLTAGVSDLAEVTSPEELAVMMASRFSPFTPLFNASGQPAMSVPLHRNSEGLPVGMQFVGRYGQESTLFRLAGQLEEAKPWFDRIPRLAT